MGTNHNPFFAAWVIVTYSASVVERVTNSYFFEDQDTALPSTMYT